MPHPHHSDAEDETTHFLLEIAEAANSPLDSSSGCDTNGLLRLSYRTYSPKRGAYRFGPVDLQVWREDGWWRRRQHEPAFPSVPAY